MVDEGVENVGSENGNGISDDEHDGSNSNDKYVIIINILPCYFYHFYYHY